MKPRSRRCDALKAAQAAVKTAAAATDVRETRAQRDALLAAALDVTVDALRTAFNSVRGTPDGMCKPRPGSSTGSTAGTNWRGASAA